LRVGDGQEVAGKSTQPGVNRSSRVANSQVAHSRHVDSNYVVWNGEDMST